jgi:tetratricopeptide (TPR) repeat protein
MEEFEFANQLSPGIGNVYELLGKGFEQQGDMKDAIESYRQACAASPNDGKLRGHLEELARKQGAPPPKSSPPSKSAAR